MEQLEKIEKYLRNSMSPDEAKAFEEEVSGDAALAHEVEMLRFEMGVIGQLEADALRATIKTLRQQDDDDARTSKAFPKLGGIRASYIRWWAAAAAVSAVLIAALFLLPKTGTPEKRIAAIIAEDHKRYPPEYLVAQRTPSEASSFDRRPIEILKKQDKSQASVAVQYFQSFITSDSILQMRARLNLAHSLLLAGDTEQAIQVFKETERAAQNNASIRQAAQYYGALAVLQKKDIAQARNLLEAIKNQPAHPYQPQAARLLPLLGKLR